MFNFSYQEGIPTLSWLKLGLKEYVAPKNNLFYIYIYIYISTLFEYQLKTSDKKICAPI